MSASCDMNVLRLILYYVGKEGVPHFWRIRVCSPQFSLT